MSYCVHCGVKLHTAEKRCPLCGTPVLDPKEEAPPKCDYLPERIDTYPRRDINWRFISELIMLILAVAAGLVVLCDFLTTGGISWSWFAMAGCAFLAGFASIPASRTLPGKLLLPFAGSAIALFLISFPLHGTRWLLLLALPAAAIITIYIAVCLCLSRKKRLRVFYRVAFCLVLLILSLVMIEVLTDLYNENAVCLFWSLYAVIPLSFLTAFFTIAAHNRRIVEYIKKNIFLSPQ